MRALVGFQAEVVEFLVECRADLDVHEDCEVLEWKTVSSWFYITAWVEGIDGSLYHTDSLVTLSPIVVYAATSLSF